MSNKLNLVISIFVAGFLSLMVYGDSAEAVGLTFQSVGTHPQAAAQSTATGKQLVDLEFDRYGNVVAGYGDYGANTGPISINPFDTNTNAFVGQQISAPTEAILHYRKIGNNLYGSWADPRGPWTVPASGFSTDRNGTWQNVGTITGVHTFDVDSPDGGTELWVSGSALTNTSDQTSYVPTLWRSKDAGATWTVMHTESNPLSYSGRDYARYYWVRVINGKVYSQAIYTQNRVPLRIYDLALNTWSDGPADDFCAINTPSIVETFHDKIVCFRGSDSKLVAYDGNTITPLNNYPGKSLRDFYVDTANDTLYVLDSKGDLYSTNDLIAWKHIAIIPSTSTYGSALSVAVKSDRVYIGTSKSQILESSTLTSTTEVNPIIQSISPSTTTVNTGDISVEIQGSDLQIGSKVTIDGRDYAINGQSGGPYSITVNTDQLSVGTYDVTYTNPSGNSSTLSNSFEVLAATAPRITSVTFSRDDQNRVIMRVNGEDFLKYIDQASRQGLFYMSYSVGNFVSMNGQKLPACVEGDIAEYYSDETDLYSQDVPCYRSISYDLENDHITPLITDTYFDVVLPADYDVRALGTVRFNAVSFAGLFTLDSNTYTFNLVDSGVNSANTNEVKKPEESMLADTGTNTWVLLAVAFISILSGGYCIVSTRRAKI